MRQEFLIQSAIAARNLTFTGGAETAANLWKTVIEICQTEDWREPRLTLPLVDGLPRLLVRADLNSETQSALLSAILRLNPGRCLHHFAASFDRVGNTLQSQGDLGDAIKAFRFGLRLREKLVAEDPGNALWQTDLVSTCNALAWTLATSSAPNYRNGPEAVILALRASELTRFQDSDTLDTLATTYAETGSFDNAVKWQEAALKLIRDAGRAVPEELLQRLELYKQQMPYRE